MTPACPPLFKMQASCVLVVEGFLDHSRQVAEQAVAFAAVGRSVHDGQSLWFEIGQRPENAFGLAGVRHVAGQRPLLQLLHRFARRPDKWGIRSFRPDDLHLSTQQLLDWLKGLTRTWSLRRSYLRRPRWARSR